MALRTMQSREPSREDTARVVRSFTAGASVCRSFVVRRSSFVARRRRVSFVVRRRVTLASNRARLFVSPFLFSQKLPPAERRRRSNEQKCNEASRYVGTCRIAWFSHRVMYRVT